MTSVARHREPSLPTQLVADAVRLISTAPRPTWSRVTTADGRSPGLRIFTLRRLPGTRVPSGIMTEDSPLTVAGAAADSSERSLPPHSHFSPNVGPSAEPYERAANSVKVSPEVVCRDLD
jgi:hypothetical protein